MLELTIMKNYNYMDNEKKNTPYRKGNSQASQGLTDQEKNLIVEKSFQELLELPRLQKADSRDKVIKAYNLAKDAHANQFRKGGLKLPYISHPIAVALIVAKEMGFGSTTIAAALLHDVVEDTKYSLENIRELFGDEIALIVDGLTKITNLPDDGLTEQSATFQKLILNISKDKRVAYVKIADRLHNLRTMDDMPINSIMIKTAEALKIYAPLAFKLGLINISKDIEDLSFKQREPEDFNRLSEIIKHNTKKLESTTKSFSESLYEKMTKDGFKYRVEPVRKSLFRMRKDMQNKKLNFDQLINFQSERIVFTPVEGKSIAQQCFDIYCKVSELYKVRPESLRDWITNVRSNGFQTLVFDIFFEDYWKEIQIMTNAMNDIAQRGYAKNHDNPHVKNINTWVNTIEKSINKKSLSNNELLELVSPDVTEIIVITPKGELIPMSKKSTVLDFAFKVHTNIGLRFLSAEVNKKIVKPDYVLQNGDMVKIITSDTVKPNESWLTNLSSAGNRAKLKEYIAMKKSTVTTLGKKIFDEIKQNYPIEKEHIRQILQNLRLANQNDLFWKLGSKSIISEDIIKLFKQNNKNNILSGLKNSITKKTQKPKELQIVIPNKKQPYIIRNLKNLSLAECCRPIPGDAAMAYTNDALETVIHKRRCPKAKELNAAYGKKTQAVKWELLTKEKTIATIEFKGIDRKGILSEMLKIIHDDLKINMNDLKMHAESNTFIGTIEFLVSDVKVLNIVIKRIQKIKGISEVRRK